MTSATIAAVATPVGRGGIGIIRMSGQDALAIAAQVFKPGALKAPGGKENDPRPIVGAFESHRMYYGHIVAPGTREVIDEVMLVSMRAPRSYTREDTVEIHSHAGPAILKQILEQVLLLGARLAQPGEFTRRAFLNGRIDLSQAEAVIDVINARTAKSLRVASRHLQGGMRNTVSAWRDILLEIIAGIEAENEFGDEAGQLFDPHKVKATLKSQLIAPMAASVQAYDSGHLLRDGLQIVVVGRPNVGKSSLMNRLINKERAIVTELPGTTRDAIEETVSISGIPAVITDTAGLHSAVEPVEVLGIRKTHESIQNADLILFLVAADDGLTDADLDIYREIQGRPVILVINKQDLMVAGARLALKNGLRALPTVMLSAKFNQGIDRLKETIVQQVMQDPNMVAGDVTIPQVRHLQIFVECLNLIENAMQEMHNGLGPEMFVSHLQRAYDQLGQVLGQDTGEDVLDQIFDRFCIGK